MPQEDERKRVRRIIVRFLARHGRMPNRAEIQQLLQGEKETEEPGLLSKAGEFIKAIPGAVVELGKDVAELPKFAARGAEVRAAAKAEPERAREAIAEVKGTAEFQESRRKATTGAALVSALIPGAGVTATATRLGAKPLVAGLAGEAAAGATFGAVRPIEEDESRAAVVATDAALFPAIGLAGRGAAGLIRRTKRALSKPTVRTPEAVAKDLKKSIESDLEKKAARTEIDVTPEEIELIERELAARKQFREHVKDVRQKEQVALDKKEIIAEQLTTEKALNRQGNALVAELREGIPPNIRFQVTSELEAKLGRVEELHPQQVAKGVRRSISNNEGEKAAEKLAATDSKLPPERSMTDQFGRDVATTFKVSVTSRFTTTSRNWISSQYLLQSTDLINNAVAETLSEVAAGRIGLGGVKRAAEAFKRAQVTGHKGLFRAKDPVLEQTEALLDRFDLSHILERMRAVRVAEIPAEAGAGRKIFSKFINYKTFTNRWQEIPARNSHLVSRMTLRLSRMADDVGKPLDEFIEQLMVEPVDPLMKAHMSRFAVEGANLALNRTFAAKPTGWSGTILKVFESSPGAMRPFLLALHAFPRFGLLNLKWIMDRSPWIAAKMATPGFWRGIKAGSQAELEAAGKIAEMTTLMALGMTMRLSPLAGREWYQMRVGTQEDGTPRYLDLRPFAPFTSPVWFAHGLTMAMQESLPGGENPTPGEWESWSRGSLDAFFGIRRLTGNVLSLPEAIARGGPGLKVWFQRFAQTFIGGFSADPILDVTAAIEEMVDPDAAAARSKRIGVFGGEGLLETLPAEFLGNIPGARRLLPEQPSRTRETALGVQEKVGGLISPRLLRQVGPTLTTETAFETEVKKLKLDLRPKTGSALYDLFIEEAQGALIADLPLNELVNDPEFQTQPIEIRRPYLLNQVTEIKSRAKKQALADHFDELVEDITTKISKHKTPEAQEQALKELKIPEELRQAVKAQLGPPLQASAPRPTGENPIGLDPRSQQFVLSNVPKRATTPGNFGGVRP